MRIPTHDDHDQPRGERAMTPMIDVVFLLLIFFVCASAGQTRESILSTELNAGSIASQEFEQEERPLGEAWLFLRRERGQTIVQLNERGVEYDDLGRLKSSLIELGRAAPEMPVILEIRPDVPMEDVLEVYSTCREARFQQILFAIDGSELQGE